MNKRIVSSIICAACALLLAGCNENSSQEPLQANLTAESHQQKVASEPVSATQVQEGVAASSTMEQLPGSEVLAANHPYLLALSVDEAAWLDRHGYPTPEELDALLTYDVEALESAMRNQGDPKSAALLGHRRMNEGDIGGALAAFSKGANLGSLYARQQFAIASAHRATGLPIDDLAQADQGNLGVMVARLEVARMLGDHRAQALIDRYTKNFHWDNYGEQVLTQTAIFMDQYGEYARARGERIIGPDPRPNAEAWGRLKQDPDALVTVYTRSHPDP